MRRPLVLALGLVLALLGGGCVRENERSAGAEPRWLQWAVEKVPPALPGPCRDRECLRWASFSGRGLVDLSAAGGTITLVPALASDWRWVTPTTLTFTLTARIRWSDGTPLEAAQFIDSWRRLLADCHRQPNAALLFAVENAEAFCDGKVPFSEVGARAIDGRTIRLTLSAPSVAFPRVLAHPALWPWRGAELSVGPFLPPRAERGGWYRAVRNPYFPREPGTIEGVRLQAEPSVENRIARFREGTFDLVDDIPSELASRLSGDPRAENWRVPRRTVLVFHPGRRPFTELAARQAFTAAIAREEPLALLRLPDWVAAGFFWPARDDARQRGPAHAATQALTLLRSLPFDTTTVRTTLAATPFAGAGALVDNLIAQWAKTLKLRVEPVGTVAESEIAMSGAAMTLVEIEERVLTPWRTLSRFAAGHPEVEVKLNKAAHARDDAELERALDAAESILADKLVVVVPLLAEGRTVLRAPGLHHLTQTPLGAWDFAPVAIE